MSDAFHRNRDEFYLDQVRRRKNFEDDIQAEIDQKAADNEQGIQAGLNGDKIGEIAGRLGPEFAVRWGEGMGLAWRPSGKIPSWSDLYLKNVRYYEWYEEQKRTLKRIAKSRIECSGTWYEKLERVLLDDTDAEEV